MTDLKTALAAVNTRLEDWRLLLVTGIIVTMVGAAMPFVTIRQGFVELPALFYLVVGLLAVAGGLWKFSTADSEEE